MPNDQMLPEPSKTVLSPKIWLGPYAIVVATLYLWGYWGSFQVNILEYISLTEIVKAAVLPIASAFAAFAFGAVLGEVLSPNPPSVGVINSTVKKWLRRMVPAIVGVYLLGVTLYWLTGPVEKWRLLPVFFAIAVYLPLKSTGLLVLELKADGARSTALFLLAALPPFAYGSGALAAHKVLSGTKYTFVASEIPGHILATGAKPNERLRLIGRANDHFFFYDPVAESTLYIAASEAKLLALKHHKATPPSPRTP
jgi:hypothetical protein